MKFKYFVIPALLLLAGAGCTSANKSFEVNQQAATNRAASMVLDLNTELAFVVPQGFISEALNAGDTALGNTLSNTTNLTAWMLLRNKPVNDGKPDTEDPHPGIQIIVADTSKNVTESELPSWIKKNSWVSNRITPNSAGALLRVSGKPALLFAKGGEYLNSMVVVTTGNKVYVIERWDNVMTDTEFSDWLNKLQVGAFGSSEELSTFTDNYFQTNK